MLIQLLANGIASGSLIALLAAGFSIQFSATRFFAFTYGAAYTISAYCLLVAAPRLPLIVAACTAIVAASVSGGILQLGLFAKIRRRNESTLVLMVASIGAYTILQNIISIVFGDSVQSIRPVHTDAGLLIFGARVTTLQLFGSAIAWITIFAT